ncbi:MAG: dihydropteroate synthase [Sorangiineae bacterium]|nr:dihydropteroate synthase [Sorangiineae bacterium]
MGLADRLRPSARRARGAALMGVLNVTPDSFSDGGRFARADAAILRVDALARDGADLIDIGGESTRPGAEPVSAKEQLERILPAVRHALREARALVSIDTADPEVADQTLALGAHVINDVSCLANPELARAVARHDAWLVIMHSRGPMREMAGFSVYPDSGYTDVVEDVLRELGAARERALRAGVSSERILIDPGLGFAKNAAQSLELLARLHELTRVGCPIVVGPSRKSFIAAGEPAPPEERLGGTIAACLLSVERGAAVLRVHDVREVRQALAVARAISPSRREEAAHA